jgi:hypothetical protein
MALMRHLFDPLNYCRYRRERDEAGTFILHYWQSQWSTSVNRLDAIREIADRIAMRMMMDWYSVLYL